MMYPAINFATIGDMIKSKILEELGIQHAFLGAERSFLGLLSTDDSIIDFLDEIKAEKLYMPVQVHSNKVAGINSMKSADAVVNNRSNVAIAVRTADCVPVLLYDKAKKLTAVIHAGWRGAMLGIVKNTIQSMVNYGGNAKDIIAAIGPAIGQDSYEVDKDFLRFFNKKFFKTTGDKYFFNLVGVVEDDLLQSGVKSIDKSAFVDTYSTEDYLSYRRDKTFDRNISYIVL